MSELIEFVTFELEADAWDYLYENGFVARLANHREFDRADGTRAVLIPGDERDTATEVKLFRKSHAFNRMKATPSA